MSTASQFHDKVDEHISEAVDWIGQVLSIGSTLGNYDEIAHFHGTSSVYGVKLMHFISDLCDGVVLCKLIAAVSEDALPPGLPVERAKFAGRRLKNIPGFAAACLQLGVPERHVLHVRDCIDDPAHGMMPDPCRISRCVMELKRVVQPGIVAQLQTEQHVASSLAWIADELGVETESYKNFDDLARRRRALAHAITGISDGSLLCRLVNKFAGRGSHEPVDIAEDPAVPVAARQARNIAAFEAACRQAGVPEHCLLRLQDCQMEDTDSIDYFAIRLAQCLSALQHVAAVSAGAGPPAVAAPVGTANASAQERAREITAGAGEADPTARNQQLSRERVQKINWLLTVPAFEQLGPTAPAIERLVDALQEETVAAGCVILTKGAGADAPPKGMYFIRDGEVEVIAEPDGPVMAVLGPGQFFGQAALGGAGGARDCFVRARTGVALEVLGADILKEVSRDVPSLEQALRGPDVRSMVVSINRTASGSPRPSAQQLELGSHAPWDAPKPQVNGMQIFPPIAVDHSGASVCNDALGCKT